MALIVEDGTGMTDADAYVDLTYASDYHSALGNSGWARSEKLSARIYVRVQPDNGDDVTIGGVTYAFVSGVPASNEIKIGATPADTAANIVAAVNYADGLGIKYAVSEPHPDVSASIDSASPWPTVLLETRRSDYPPPTIALSESVSNPAFALSSAELEPPSDRDELERAIVNGTRTMDAVYGSRLIGSRKTQTQALAFPRVDMESLDGFDLPDDEVPTVWKNCVCEMALVVLQRGDIMPSQSPDEARRNTSESITVGPISISESADRSTLSTGTSIPRIDAMLEAAGLISSVNSVRRR